MLEAKPIGLCHINSSPATSLQRPGEQSGSRKFDVIAVHGLNGHREDTWTYEGDPRVMWLKDFLPQHLCDARIMTFGYRLEGEGISTAEITEKAVDLLDKLRDMRKSDENRSIVFVGHDLGGVIIKHALLIAGNKTIYSAIATRTCLLVFFGTPHRAPNLNSWENIACNLLRMTRRTEVGQLSENLSLSAQTLMECSEDYEVIARIYSVLNFFEKQTSASSHVVINQYTATFGLPDETNMGLDSPHFEMCKFIDNETAAFKLVCERIDGSSDADDQYIECVRTLSALDTDGYLSNATAPHPEAFRWLENHRAFQSWLEDPKSCILQLHARPGSGMSLLASFLERYLLTAVPDATIIRFSFDERDYRHRSTYRMLASLSYQLLSLKPSLFEHIRHLYNIVIMEPNLKIDRLWVLFRSLISCPSLSATFCIVDAIEQCDSSQAFFLEDLLTLLKSERTNFKLIITSNSPPSDISLSGVTIDLDELDERKRDIERIVETEITDLVRKRPAFRCIEYGLKSRILSRDSTILSATLTLSLLEVIYIPSTRSSMEQELTLYPQSLRKIYRRFLGEIPSARHEWARRALSWIVHAFRPLKLEELALALAIMPGTTSFDEIEHQLSHDIVLDLKRTFGHLIRIRNNEVLFVHQSFRRFLIDGHVEGEPCRGPNRCLFHLQDHSVIAEACLKYLSLNDPPEIRYTGDQPEIHVAPEVEYRYHLLPYAVQFWPEHHRLSKADHKSQDQVRDFFKDPKLMRMWSELYWCQGNPATRRSVSFKDLLPVAVSLGCSDLVETLLKEDSVHDDSMSLALNIASERGDSSLIMLLLGSGAKSSTVLHMAAANGHHRLVLELLSLGHSVAALSPSNSTPLLLASQSGYVRVVKILIDADADVNARDKDGSTSLHLASEFGHAHVIKRLLFANADPSAINKYGSTPLHLSVEAQQLGAVSVLLRKLVNVEVGNTKRLTPLHLAAKSGNVEIVRMLLDSFVNQPDAKTLTIDGLLDLRDNEDSSPLHMAARGGHLKVVNEFIDRFRHIQSIFHAQDQRHNTPMHLAASRGHLEVVKLLVEADPTQIEMKNQSNSRPIHLAALNGHTGVVELLCQHGSRLDIFDGSLSTPLHIASKKGFTEIVKILLEKGGAEVDIADMNDKTPLHLASQGGFLPVVELLVHAGAEIMATDDESQSPLHLASQGGHAKVVEALLRAGADLNTTDRIGQSPLHDASANGHQEAVSCLVKNGADIFAEDDKKRTPLHLASLAGHVAVLDLLLPWHADPLAVDDENLTPLHLASQGGHLKAVKKLFKAITKPNAANLATALHLSAEKGHVEVVKQLLSFEGINVNERDEEGRTPLLRAAEAGHFDVVELLLANPKVTRDPRAAAGRTLLSYMAEKANADQVRLLLENTDIEIEAKDKQERTPLSYAAGTGNLDVVRFLLTLPNIDINSVDHERRTPLLHAAISENHEIIEELLRHNANPNICDASGATALHKAALNGAPETAKVLLDCAKFTMGNFKDERESTPMYIAAYYGHVRVIEELLAHNIETETPGPNGWRPLHAAHDDVRIVKLLVSAKAEIDAKTSEGRTALDLALSSGYEDVALELIDAGANPLMLDNKGDTPLHSAIREGSAILEKLLMRASDWTDAQHKKQETPFHSAILGENAHGINSVQEGEDGQLTLSHAAGGVSLKDSEIPLTTVGTESAQEIISWEDLILYAAQHGRQEIMSVLLEKVPRPLVPSEGLIKAAFDQEHSQLADHLLRAGADPDSPDEYDWTLDMLRSLSRTDGVSKATDHIADIHQPKSWSSKDRSPTLTVEDDGVLVAYLNTNSRAFRIDPVGAIRANRPIPPQEEFYFEVKILDQGKNSAIGIGICQKSSALNMMPGWENSSWGYHGDDAQIFHSYGRGVRSYGERFGTDDIVGCGVNLVNGTVFFTKNGVHLGQAFEGVSGRLFPCVGMKSYQARVRVNFGQEPFEYKRDIEIPS